MTIGRGAYAAMVDGILERTRARGAMLILFRVSEDGLLKVERETHLFTPLTGRVLGVILRDIADELTGPDDGVDPDAPAESGVASRRARTAPPSVPAKKRQR